MMHVVCARVTKRMRTTCFFGCDRGKEVWNDMLKWWGMKLNVTSSNQCMASLLKLKGTQSYKKASDAIFFASIFHIWSARNYNIFKKQSFKAQTVIMKIKKQAR